MAQPVETLTATQQATMRDSIGVAQMRSNLRTRLENSAGVGERIAVSVLGDSTGNDDTEWPVRLITLEDIGLAARYPAFTFRTLSAADVSTVPKYTARSVVRQVGTAGIRHVVLDGSSQCVVSSDNAIYDITSNQTHSVYVYYDPADAGSGERIFAAKWGSSGQYSWKFGIDASGNLFGAWSANGTAVNTHDSGVAASSVFTSAGWKWVEVRFDAAAGSMALYQSSDSASWSLIGSATTIGASSVFNSTAPVVIGASGPSGTYGSWFKGKVSEYQGATGTGGSYAMATAWWAGVHRKLEINSYGSYRFNWSMVGTPSVLGAPEFILFNSSISGKDTTYHDTATNYQSSCPIRPSAVIINHGHNQASNDNDTFCTNLSSLVSRVLTDSVHCDVYTVVQNPQKSAQSGYEKHNRMMLALPRYAAKQGWIPLDAYGAILANSNWETELMTDNVHPNATGMDLIATKFLKTLLA